jgi:hypothetical protein
MLLLILLIVLILALGGGGFALPNARNVLWVLAVVLFVLLIAGWPMRWYYP